MFDPENGVPDGVFQVTMQRERPPLLISAHEVRDVFLAISTNEDVLRFTQLFGSIAPFGIFNFILVKEWQEKIARARELPPREFFFPADGISWDELFDRNPPEAKLIPGPLGSAPRLKMVTTDPIKAMLFANYLDQIANIRASTCPQCKKQFVLHSAKRKIYCTDYCQRVAGKARWSKKAAPAAASKRPKGAPTRQKRRKTSV